MRTKVITAEGAHHRREDRNCLVAPEGGGEPSGEVSAE